VAGAAKARGLNKELCESRFFARLPGARMSDNRGVERTRCPGQVAIRGSGLRIQRLCLIQGRSVERQGAAKQGGGRCGQSQRSGGEMGDSESMI
jgi:hypothetical protein